MMRRATTSFPAALGLALVTLVTAGTASAADRPPSPSSWSIDRISVPFTIGVSRPLEIEAVNRSLDQVGAGRLAVLMSNLSIATSLRLVNGLVLETQYRMTIASSDEASLLCHHGLLNVGYVVAKRGEVALYPFLGLGFAAVALDFASSKLETQSFADVLADPHGDASLTSWSFVTHAGIAADLWGSGHGDFVGLRTGLLLAPARAGWKRRDESVTGGPAPPMGGFYFAIAIGFHGPLPE